MMYDLIIIGAGPGGLAAGIYARYFRLNAVVLDNIEQPSQLAMAPKVANYPGVEQIPGTELIERMKKQVKALGGTIKEEKASAIKMEKDKKVVYTDKGKYETKSIIIATGAVHRQGGIKGEKEFMGKGVSYCATCDGIFYIGKSVVVLGGGDTALAYATYLKSIGCDVTLIHRRDEFRGAEQSVEVARKAGVKFVLKHTVQEIVGKKSVEKVVLDDGTEIKCSGVFVAFGEVPVVDLFKSIGVKANEGGFIEVDGKMQTSVKGIYAVGDATTTPFRQVAMATGQATLAVFNANKYVREQK